MGFLITVVVPLLPVLRGEERAGERPLFFGFANHRALIRGRWKLVAGYGGPWELYDLETDRTELDDRAAREPERVEQLSEEWQEIRRQLRLGTPSGPLQTGPPLYRSPVGADPAPRSRTP